MTYLNSPKFPWMLSHWLSGHGHGRAQPASQCHSEMSGISATGKFWWQLQQTKSYSDCVLERELPELFFFICIQYLYHAAVVFFCPIQSRTFHCRISFFLLGFHQFLLVTFFLTWGRYEQPRYGVKGSYFFFPGCSRFKLHGEAVFNNFDLEYIWAIYWFQ